MLPISVCIIAKNEADYLNTCLTRLAPYNFELIVVDTGSTDRTIEIANLFTPHVYSFVWCDDFSAARNYSITKASNDWILVVDCDEHLTSLDLTLFLQELNTFYAPTTIGQINRSSSYTRNGQVLTSNQPVARLFSKSYFHYVGRIHEQIEPLKPSGDKITYQVLPIAFYHEGYQSEPIIAQKSARNIALLEKDLAEDTSNPYTYFQLGQSYFTIENYDKALSYFTPALSFDLNPDESYVQTMIESYGYCLIYLKRFEEALSLEGIYKEFCKSADFVFLMGLIYMNNGLFDDAIAQFEYATTFPACNVEGVNSYASYYNIGVIYECSNRTKEALVNYKKAKNYEPALNRLKLLQ